MSYLPNQIQKILLRFQNLETTIVYSESTKDWTRDELNEMAEMCCVLWDQADDASLDYPSLRGEMSDALSKVLERLLLWTGETEWCRKLAEQRLFRAEKNNQPEDMFNALSMIYVANGILFRYEDPNASHRLIRTKKINKKFRLLIDLIKVIDVNEEELAWIGWGLYLMGQKKAAVELMKKTHCLEAVLNLKETCAPHFWLDYVHLNEWIQSVEQELKSNHFDEIDEMSSLNDEDEKEHEEWLMSHSDEQEPLSLTDSDDDLKGEQTIRHEDIQKENQESVNMDEMEVHLNLLEKKMALLTKEFNTHSMKEDDQLEHERVVKKDSEKESDGTE